MTSPELTRQAFLRLLERPRVPLALEATTLRSGPVIVCERFSFEAEAGERVPGLLLRGSAWREARPAVIVAHGTGGSKEAVLPLLTALCERGFVALAIDGRHHGERAGAPDAGSTRYVAAIFQKFLGSSGFPFLYDTVWDSMRLLDLLEQRPEVDATRVALLGISKGGMETYLTAAADPRLAVAIPVLGVQSYGHALRHDAWRSRVETIQPAFDAAARHAGVEHPDADFVRRFYDRVVPGIYTDFDGPAMLPLIAPRPLLVINGELDARTPGLELCRREAEAAYVSAPEALHILVQRQIGHEFGNTATEFALRWLTRWLAPPQQP